MKNRYTYEAVIAAKDMEATIAETIESLLKSSAKPEKIWIVDDGSSDDTGNIASGYKVTEVITNVENRERSYSRNRGIRNCTAPYIQIIDADDLLHSDKVEKQLHYMERNPEVDAVFGARSAFTDDFTPQKAGKPESYNAEDDLLNQLLQRNIIIPGMLLFRSHFFEKYGLFDETIKIAEDRELLIRALVKGAVIHQVSEAVTYYRRHDGSSVEKQYRQGLFNNYKMFVKLFEEIWAYKKGVYRCQLAGSLRMMARNLNIYGFPFELIRHCLDMAKKADSEWTIEQNGLYNQIDRWLGPLATEYLLRPKFKLDHFFGRY